MDMHIKIGFSVGAAILVIAFVFAYINFGSLENLLVVHFDVYRGIDFLGSKADVFAVLASGVAMLAINFWLAWIFRRRDQFFSYVLAVGTVFLSVLIFLAITGIISIN